MWCQEFVLRSVFEAPIRIQFATAALGMVAAVHFAWREPVSQADALRLTENLWHARHHCNHAQTTSYSARAITPAA
jgi:hypothetical protein